MGELLPQQDNQYGAAFEDAPVFMSRRSCLRYHRVILPILKGKQKCKIEC